MNEFCIKYFYGFRCKKRKEHKNKQTNKVYTLIQKPGFCQWFDKTSIDTLLSCLVDVCQRLLQISNMRIFVITMNSFRK